jgi:hypothetical protein
MMKTMLALPIALLLALSVPALAQNPNNNGNHGQGNNGNGNGGSIRGAPGPLMGAGLPVLLVGGGIYWVVRRRQRAKSGL